MEKESAVAEGYRKLQQVYDDAANFPYNPLVQKSTKKQEKNILAQHNLSRADIADLVLEEEFEEERRD